MYALDPSLVEVALGLAVAEVVYEDDAGDVVVEDVARVAVRLRPAHVEQLCRMERRKGMSLKLCQSGKQLNVSGTKINVYSGGI